MAVRSFQTTRLVWQDEQLEAIPLPRGFLRVTRGVGSGLTQSRADAPHILWAIGDRGPNLKVGRAIKRYGLEQLRPLKGLDGAKVMPCLEHGPEFVELRLEGDQVTRVRCCRLRSSDGQPISGLPPPVSAHAECEPIFSLNGEALGTDPSGVDSEGIAALADGGFWIADEYGPSLLKVDREGSVAVRLVPIGSEHSFAGAAYPVAPVLPAIASARRLNRGFEALAVSPDERSLYVAFQSPLAHPDRAAHERSNHVRIWKLDASSGEIRAEFIYPLDPPSAFKRDLEVGPIEPWDIKVSEALILGTDRLLVLERGSASTKFYSVDLLPQFAVPAAFRELSTRPTIEQMNEDELVAAGIVPLTKTLVFDTDDAPEICADLEGAVLLSPRELLLVNDNDFGVDGVGTEFWRVTFDEDVT